MSEISQMPLVAYADVDPDTVSLPILDSDDPVARRRNKRMLLKDIAKGQKGDPFTWDDLTEAEKNELASNAIVEVTALKDEAIVAKDAAEAAQLASEQARDASEGFATDSGNAATASSTSAGQSQNFSIASGNSASAASGSASAASGSASAAAAAASAASANADQTAEDRIAVNALRDSAGVFAGNAENAAIAAIQARNDVVEVQGSINESIESIDTLQWLGV